MTRKTKNIVAFLVFFIFFVFLSAAIHSYTHTVTVTFFILLGLIFGSFGSVLVMRLPEREGIGGRSKCPHCGTTLRVLSLIPIFSYLIQRGRCSECEARIAWLYPALEIASALLFVIALMTSTSLSGALLQAFILWTLLLIAAIDARTQTIPDALNLLLCFFGVLLVFHRGSVDLLALIAGTGFLGIQWLLSHGRWVGSGDVFLMLGLGLVLPSVTHIILTLMIAYILGAFVAAILLATGRTKLSNAVAFGPFIVMGAFVTTICGAQIIEIFNI